MVDVIGDAIAVAIVAFAISVSMAQLFAKRHNYECDSNQVRRLITHVVELANYIGIHLWMYLSVHKVELNKQK